LDAEKIAVGRRAPDFQLPGLNGESASLGEAISAGPVVLYFMRAFQ
jgi:peroxiredoxin